MSLTMQCTGTLVIEVCCNCGIAFAMPEDYRQRRLDDRRDFYCPAGHAQHFIGKTEEQRLRERLAAARESEEFYRQQAASARRSAAAHRGQVTRIRNLVAKGICPVAGCRRNFTNVREHMASEHPDYHLHDEAVRP